MSPTTTLPVSWSNWVTENLSLGVPRSEIASVLRENGFDLGAVDQLAAASLASRSGTDRRSPELPKGKVQDLMTVYSQLWRTRGAAHCDRVANLSPSDFFRWYYSLNNPVVLLDGAVGWAAVAHWTPDYLASRSGRENVEVMWRRNEDPQYELNSERHKTRMLLRDFVDLVRTAGETNDFYMVANNHSLDQGNMRALLNELNFPDGILDRANAEKRIFLWFGPAGTITPLHHDTCNVLFAQIYGRKLVTLIPSWETHLMYNSIGVYSEVDCEHPDLENYPLFRETSRMQVVLEPGQMLFIPVGWWHHVRSLDISISVSFTNFKAPNEYTWTS